MPTYEYKCLACGRRLEAFQSIMAKPLRRCSHCGKASLKRLISAGAGLIFKGSGFYETDYRSEAYKTDAKADVPAPPAKDDKSTGSDKKAATTTDAKPAKTESAEPSPKPSGRDTKGQKKAKGS